MKSVSFDLAYQKYEQEKYQEAITLFIELLKTNNTEICLASCFYLSKCFYYLKDEANRLYYLICSFQYDNGSPEIYCELGYYYMDKYEYSKAITFFQSSLSCRRAKDCKLYLESHRGFLPSLSLSLCYYSLKNLKLAYQYNQLADYYQPGDPAVIHNEKFYAQLMALTSPQEINRQKQTVLKQREEHRSDPVFGVSLITITNKAAFMDTIFENYNRMNYPKKELILVLNKNDLKIEQYQRYADAFPNVRIYQLDESITLGSCLNFAVSKAQYDYVAKIDDDDFYGENYLTDQMNCFSDPEVFVVTKSIRLIYFEADQTLFVFHGHGENTEVIGGGGGTIVAKKSVFDNVQFHDINCAEDEHFFLDCTANQIKIYASNRFNYVYRRHVNPKDHTYVIADFEFKRHSDEILFEGNYEEIASV